MLGATQLMQIKRFGSVADTRRIASGTTMFVKGAPGSAVFAVVSGTVKIAVSSIDGREATFDLLHAGDIFGEIAVLDSQPRTDQRDRGHGLRADGDPAGRFPSLRP
jgi:CRP/FNR family transcriptional regulator, cyclic AMP receptor protein